MMNSISRRRRAAFALAAVLSLAMAGVAEARAGRSGSLGSRGSQTHNAPPSTQTAPGQARPIERSVTQPGAQTGQPGVRQPGAPGAVGAPARSRFGGGFFAGLLGAGLLGALLGAGFFGGLGSLAAIFGLLLQVALIGGLIWLAVRFFRSRRQPSYAGQTPTVNRTGLGAMPPRMGGGMMGGRMGGMAGTGLGAGAAGAAASAPVEIGPADFDAFERTLYDVQGAYNRGDVGALRGLTTPEMAAYFEEELAEDERKGLKAHVTGVKLLQGDLAEAWREERDEYATVAMRYQLMEGVTERATGRVVQGDPNLLTEAKEVWTFRREMGEPWRLSAIQQA